MNVIIIFLEAVTAFFIGTIGYDLLHYFFHVCLKSPFLFLKRIGRWHSAHHGFFSAKLDIQHSLTRQNLIKHVLLEYLTQLGVSSLCFLFFNPFAVVLALIFESGLFFAVIYWRGSDPHHRPYKMLPSYRGGPFVTADYHALHHVFPHQFFSGYIKVLDYLLGTAMPLKDKSIVLTGASGALGRHMKVLLEKQGAVVIPIKFGVDYDYDHYEKLHAPLAAADILFLCHGSKYEQAQLANCDSFVKIIELFKAVRPRALVPLEVWGVGSEIECHPCFGIKKLQVYAKSKRNYALHAKKYFHDRDIQYRHIVHSAFWSRMGPGLMSARFAAYATLFFLKRGFKYVPVTYTGIAFINYFQYAWKRKLSDIST